MRHYLIVTIIAFLALLTYTVYRPATPPSTMNPADWSDALIADGAFLSESSVLEKGHLEQRRIISTTCVNAKLCHRLISQLLTLEQLAPGKPIDLYLRSDGGWEGDIFAVIDVMHSINSPVHIHAMGDVCSAGAMLLTAATGERVAYPHSIISYHSLTDDELQHNMDRYQSFWRTYSEIPEDWILDTSDEFYDMNAQEALQNKVIDRIQSSVHSTK